MASTEKSIKKEKNQNIQVFVRLRPLNQRERAIRSLGVVDVVNNREVVVRQTHTKKFTFDRAFAPNAEQVEVYREVVSPLIAEVLAGYNCTVFAYGQTGTGKTHTMVGESSSEGTTWQNDPLAGIIPRALSQLFDELRISNAEYTVRVSYLEIYNEELFDLLASSTRGDLRIYEDVTRKGSTIVNGLEEVTVYNKNEVYEIMAQGQERKRVASTQMNAQSSRSHTVFTIVVHMKENCSKGEELVKIGKLNLVDLAGSENISKAGSDNPAKKERARECVNINQSLLTLGRVITALVEKHPHIPYRESKLTRILQESLGGRTKTSIIATISPGHKDLEETMSTLEYANRAKNIQNKPEVNQKLTKQAILKEFAEEVDKLKRELTAAREKSGVHLPKDTYDEMLIKDDVQRREIQELLLKKRAMEEERERMETVFSELSQRCARNENTLISAQEKLDRTVTKLAEKEQQVVEKEHLVDRHRQTEGQLTAQARQLIEAADAATSDVDCLHDTVERRRTVESTNQEVLTSYREQSNAHRQKMVSGVQDFSECFAGVRGELQTTIDDHARDSSQTQEMNIQDMKLLIAKMSMFVNEMNTLTTDTQLNLTKTSDECRSQLESSVCARRDALQAVLAGLVRAVAACVERAAASDVTGTVARSTEQWLSGASARVSCLQRAHATHDAEVRTLETKRDENARKHYRERVAQLKTKQDTIHACMQELEKDKKSIEERMTRQLAIIEAEREETERRLQHWMEEERRSLEERMDRHVENERNALNSRIEKYIEELDLQKEMYEGATARCVQMQQIQLQANREEEEMAKVHLELCKSEIGECLKKADEFAREFGEGTSAINAEMEAYSRSVVQIVGHSNDQLMSELRSARGNVEAAASDASATDAAATQQFCSEATAAVAGAVESASSALSTIVEKAEASTSSTIETLGTVTARTSRLASAALTHQEAQSASLARATQAVETLDAGLREEVARHADMEGRYLMQEYRVYSPSGNTPARREYRYPRRLVATSPHERILARFRAMQPRDSHDSEDCIVVESDEGRNTSDSDISESSVSEDSAVNMQRPSRHASESPCSEDSTFFSIQ